MFTLEPVNTDPIHTTGTSVFPSPAPTPALDYAGHKPVRSASAPSRTCTRSFPTWLTRMPLRVSSPSVVSVIASATISPTPPTHSASHQVHHSHRDPFPKTVPFESPAAAAQSVGPKVSVVPWFISTMDHSDFSHGITSDFALRLIRPATQLRRVDPYEISRGNAENFPTAPPAHTLLCPGAPSISFAPIVQARHHLDRADRFAILGYGSVFRLKPFRPHLTAGALSCATDQPHTANHHHHHAVPPNDAQRGITPAFGYGPRLGPVRLDFHQLALCAARRTLRGSPPRCSASVLSPSQIQLLGVLPHTDHVNPRPAPSERAVPTFHTGA